MPSLNHRVADSMYFQLKYSIDDDSISDSVDIKFAVSASTFFELKIHSASLISLSCSTVKSTDPVGVSLRIHLSIVG